MFRGVIYAAAALLGILWSLALAFYLAARTAPLPENPLDAYAVYMPGSHIDIVHEPCLPEYITPYDDYIFYNCLYRTDEHPLLARFSVSVYRGVIDYTTFIFRQEQPRPRLGDIAKFYSDGFRITRGYGRVFVRWNIFMAQSVKRQPRFSWFAPVTGVYFWESGA